MYYSSETLRETLIQAVGRSLWMLYFSKEQKSVLEYAVEGA